VTVIAEGGDFPSAGSSPYEYLRDEAGNLYPVRQGRAQGVVSRPAPAATPGKDERDSWSDYDTYHVARVEMLEGLAEMVLAGSKQQDIIAQAKEALATGR